MTATTNHGSSNTADKSTAQLVHDLTEQVRHLVQTEVTLAAHELKSKAKHAGLGAAIAGAGGVFAFYGGATAVTTVVLLLALVLPAWAAALIVTGALFLVAGIAVLIARKQLQQGKPMPSPAAESVKEDVQVIKEARR
jgi:uncharacterized membrane protein YqjE